MKGDRIGKYRADYSPLSADDLACDDPELTELYMTSQPKRSRGPSKVLKTHCKQGHEFTEENTIWKTDSRTKKPRRICRKCKATSKRLRGSAFRVSREDLRRLVDIVWNEATESTAVPSTKWANKLIDKALALSNGERGAAT